MTIHSFTDNQIQVISWWMLQSKTLNLYKSTFFDRNSISQSYNRHQHLYQHYCLAHLISTLTFQLQGQLQWLNYFSEAWLKAEYGPKSDHFRHFDLWNSKQLRTISKNNVFSIVLKTQSQDIKLPPPLIIY